MIYRSYATFIFFSLSLRTSLTLAWWGYQLTKTVQHGGPQAISEILHIEYRIVCFIETHLSYEQV